MNIFFKFYQDNELRYGCSGQCETFESPPLAREEQFTCVACELYSFESTI